MKKMLLLAMVLTSCAPGLQLAQRETASLAREAGAVVFRNPGGTAAQVPAVFLRGAGLVVSAQHDGREVCQPRLTPGSWGCALPDVPGAQAFRIAVTAGAAESGSVTFYREASQGRPLYLELQ